MKVAIPNETIQQIIEKADIVDVVSKYVSLKRNGNSTVGLCPFHNEKTPSFHVSSSKQLYHCFGCGEGGTVINFVMKAENLDFVEAVKFLGDMYGVRVDETVYDDKQARRRKRLYEINKDAAKFFYATLGTPDGKEGLNYFLSRGLSKEIITKFGLGFAPNSWDKLKNHLKAKGYTDYEMVDAGLVSTKDKRTFDRFRNRVMFPIMDVRGNVIAFGGRVLDDSKPKYLNTSETPVFDKSANLYALNISKKSNSKTFVVVEGYMDVITLHQHGVDTAVASLGTALTSNHAKLLKKYADSVVLCYDSDEAGKTAAMRAVEIFSKYDIKTKVITLKGAKDPDEYCKKFGVSRFFEVINGAQDPILYKIGNLKAKYDISIPDQKAEFIKEAAGEIANFPSEIDREIYAKEIATQFDISYDAVNSQIRYKLAVNKKKNNRKEQTKVIADLKQRAVINKDGSLLLKEAEKKLLNLMFYDNKVFKYVKENFDFSNFSTVLYKEVAEKTENMIKDKKELQESELLLEFPENSGEISEILSREIKAEDKMFAARQILQTINNFRKKAEITRLAKSGDIEGVQKLLNKED